MILPGCLVLLYKPVSMTHEQLTDRLITSTTAMFTEGRPLMSRILPGAEPAALWQHYPANDVVNGAAGSRYF